MLNDKMIAFYFSLIQYKPFALLLPCQEQSDDLQA